MRWRFSPEGRLVEFRYVGANLVFRPIVEAEVGKNLAEERKLHPAEAALVEYFKRIKRRDRPGLEAMVDFEKMAARAVPGFADKSGEERAKALEEFKKDYLDRLVGLSDQLPGEEQLEGVVLSMIQECKEKDGVWVLVAVQGPSYRMQKTGDRWKVCGIEPK